MAFVGTAIEGVPIEDKDKDKDEDEDVAVPEPTTIVLMAIGLAGLATRRRSLISNYIDGFLRT